MFTYTFEFLGSAFYSVLVEVGAIWFLLRFVWKQSQIPIRDIIAAGVFATIATIPYVWYIFPILFYHSSTTALLLGEIFAVIIETIIYTFWLRQPLGRAFLLALIANIISYSTGQLVHPSQFFTDL